MGKRVAALLWSACVLFAQTNRGGIAGTVTDASGAVVPGAVVTISNLGTNAVRKVITAGNGSYSVQDLDPVTYRVQVEAKGFQKALVDGVKVNTASTAPVDIKLAAGSVETTVTVSANSAMVDTQSGTAANTITERMIQDAPLLNRSVLDLALTLPGVSGDAGSEDPALVSVTPCPGCNLVVNGGRPMSTLMLADGTNNTGVSLGRTMVSFTPETVQEFTVQTSAFSAQYGTTGGGVINATTKSGTNQLNGTALWYNRNPAFAAAPYTTAAVNRAQPTLKYNQFSLTAGGPVYIPKVYDGRNKTFWFAAYEPQYRRDRLDQYGLLPEAAQRGGDFSGLVNTPSGWLPQSVVNQFQSIAPAAVGPVADSTLYNIYTVNGNQFTQTPLASGQTAYPVFPGNQIPSSMLDASAQKALAYIAQPGPYFLNANGRISNIVAPRLLRQDEKRYLLRVDQTISDKDRLYGRFTSTPIVKTQTTPVSPTNNAAVYSWGKQAMLADTHIFTPTLFNDLRLDYTRGRFSNTAAPEYDAATGQNINTLLGLSNITAGGVPAFNGLFPGTSFNGGGSTATGFGQGGSTELEDREERYEITDTVYKTHGAMSWSIGVDLAHALQNVTPLFAALGGQYGFSAIQTNVPNGNITLRNAEVPYYYRWNSAAVFVQNDWKIRPNLTLNLGLRYSLQMPRTEKYNHQGVFRPDLTQNVPLPGPLTLADGSVLTTVAVPPFQFSGVGGASRYLTRPQYRDFEPRFGFAWSPGFLQGRHVVLRGGWGLSHAPISGFTQLPQPDFSAASALATTVPSGAVNPNAVMRLGENPPLLIPESPDQVIYGAGGPPANGLVYLNSLFYQQSVGGFAVSSDYHTPYVENWNFTVSWQANPSTVVEVAYSGAMGIHLFMGQEDLNPKDSPLISTELGQNLNPTATVADPLGRKNPFTGKVLTVQNGSLGSPYLGFSSLNLWFDSSGNSIYHSGYINVTHRLTGGLTLIGNYTLSKSIDTASSAGGDKNILTPVNGQVGGQVIFGGTRANDRSVSTFDQTHVIHGVAVYDLPVGRGRKFMTHAWKPLEFLAGGWTTSGIFRTNSGFPYLDYLSDTNQLGDLTHSARPDLVPGVPLVNPLYSSNCPIGANCQPYLNPSAFMRPPLGALGTAPRALSGVRGPWQNSFDFSLQKSFELDHEGRRRIQFRVDALNLFNHPNFAVFPNNAGGADFMGPPSTGTLSTAQYNAWASANGRPAASTAAGAALYNQVLANVNQFRSPRGALPADFFTVPLPANFYGNPATSYDITNVDGYRLYMLRTAYNQGFGDLYNNNQPRFIQFGVKVYF
ncbi:MAG: carboxypeptidase-like regulatory domain-containing protein [Acidobacteriia bacterium]|nr:carboxypeptidase-like regulatory domain-containing protein [Terriglobia bacterium]